VKTEREVAGVRIHTDLYADRVVSTGKVRRAHTQSRVGRKAVQGRRQATRARAADIYLLARRDVDGSGLPKERRRLRGRGWLDGGAEVGGGEEVPLTA
jgi:hypothetical protein